MMKVRIGVGAGPTRGDAAATTAEMVDGIEKRGIDSVWFPDRIANSTIDPLTAMAWAVGRTSTLKVGSGVIVLPGRNPAQVAAQLASMAALAPKRILPVFGLRPATPGERTFFPVTGPRTAVFEEAVTVVRRLLTEESVTFHGAYFTLDDAVVAPRPPRPLDLWLGGHVPAALERVGRLGDGWLASFVTPDEARAAIATIVRAADAAGREVEEDHYGANLVLVDEATDPAELDSMRRLFARQRPEADPDALLVHGWDAARREVGRFVEAGVTKFVIRPATAPRSWDEWLDGFATTLVPLEN